MVWGIWYWVYGIGYMVLGIGYMVLGIWYWVYGNDLFNHNKAKVHEYLPVCVPSATSVSTIFCMMSYLDGSVSYLVWSL